MQAPVGSPGHCRTCSLNALSTHPQMKTRRLRGRSSHGFLGVCTQILNKIGFLLHRLFALLSYHTALSHLIKSPQKHDS